ncbi:MAG: polysaccharide deacetylase family protein [Clostridia bacterium]|nr:polysaccharide deacetylase family protein [Clostridia bacterium]
MNAKKWFLMFISALLFAVLCWIGLNVAVDPFNAFGDPVMDWGGYTQTLNPRNSKVTYVTKNFDKFDSYVIGSSNAASYLPETLNKSFGGSFYNMFHYGSDTAYDVKLVKYLTENDDVKRIFLVLGMSEANHVRKNSGDLNDKENYRVTGESPLSYYAAFAFASPGHAFKKLKARSEDEELPKKADVFIQESGCYDKRIRDAEAIGTLEEYMQLHSDDFPAANSKSELARIDECLNDVAEIKRLCDISGTTLTVVFTPVYIEQLELFTDESIDRLFSGLANITDYRNYSVSPISFDARYFYDLTHTRNATADMVIGAEAGEKDIYLPEHFGYEFSSSKIYSAAEMKNTAKDAICSRQAVRVPVLLYHNTNDNSKQSTTNIHSDELRRQIKLIKDNGYQFVSLEDVKNYVYRGIPLPEYPVLLTFDDGYSSNYSTAYPIIKEEGAKATVFMIGCSAGKNTYKDTGKKMIPHFSIEEAVEMSQSGYVSIQSHTFDMHQYKKFEENTPARTSANRFKEESMDEYYNAVNSDIDLQNTLFTDGGLDEPYAFSFPKGKVNKTADAILVSRGYVFTFSTDKSRVNEIAPGLGQSLVDLGRYTVSSNTTDKQLLDYLAMNG